MAGYAGGGPGVDIVELALQQVDAIVRTLTEAVATTEQDFTAIQATLHRQIADASTATANAIDKANELNGLLETAMQR